MNKELERYKQQLLDIGKRNQLVNLKKDKKNNLEIIYPNIEELFINTDNLTFFDSDDFLAPLGKDSYQKEDCLNLNKYFKKNTIVGYKSNLTVKKVLKDIYNRYNESVVEKGINTLFITYGLVEYLDVETSMVTYAPLLLREVEILNTFRKNYELKFSDEIILNPTLKFKFENDFKVLLPEYKQEEFHAYIDEVNKIIEKHNFKVENLCYLGHFSYLKMNMYHDLKDNENEVLGNNLIQQLLGEKINVNEKTNNEELKYDTFSNLHNVVDADSSQEEAILALKNGKSFVLQGPPGTGKSQTITNIIAECLYDNKSVLFVSEKKAALEVVANNLTKAGLNDYFLELHSYKANKSEVINEFNRVLKNNDDYHLTNNESLIKDYQNNIQKLEEYNQVLHSQIKEIGYTPYEAFSNALNDIKAANKYKYSFKNPKNLNKNFFDISIELLSEYQDYCKYIGEDYKKCPYYGYALTDDSYNELNLVNEEAKIAFKYYESYETLAKLANNRNINLKNKNEIDRFITNALIISKYNFSSEIKNKFDFAPIYQIMEESKSELEELNKLKDAVSKCFNVSILDEDLEFLTKRFKENYKSFFRIFKSQYHADMKYLNSFKNDEIKLNYELILEYIERINKYHSQQDKCQTIINSLNSHLTVNTNELDGLITDLDLIDNLKPSEKKQLIIAFKDDGCEELINAYKKIRINKKNQAMLDSFKARFDKNIIDFNNDDLTIIVEKLNGILSSNYLNYYISFNKILPKLKKNNLLGYIDECIEKNDTKDLIDIYKKIFFTQLSYLILDQNPALKDFVRVDQNKTIESFINEDKVKFELNKAEIISKLQNNKPDLNLMVNGSPASIIIKESAKKRRQMPLNLFFENTKVLSQKLKPCFLMSPLSVSTFLSKDINFDVLIFDEASQIFPEDALGAIYRAKQMIIVGDSKQMPPTNFFMSSLALDDDYDEDGEDAFSFESILDLALANAFPQYSLKWHYRSKCEDLIAFSNHNFYENNLMTFPSTITKNVDNGVNFIYCSNGIYDRKSRTNYNEANRVVDEVMSHLLRNDRRSIGVVAFSQSQQQLIEDLVDKRREKDVVLDSLFSSLKEPFFVKNLETVQGDERDVIIFSIGYGYDENHKFLMNFGPLGKQGGERRLNVAITRAKYQVKIVSSIKYIDIDEKRVTTLGPKLLRAYLEYGEKGNKIFENKKQDSQDNNYFKQDIFNVLKSSGYEVSCNVGTSSYQIDFIIKNNDNLFAIECDGDNFAKMNSVRDRERLRPQVLQSLGWKYYRLYSTNWFKHRDSEIKLLLDFIENNNKEKVKERIQKVNENDFLIKSKKEEVKLSSLFDQYPDLTNAIATNYSSANKVIDIINDIVTALAPIHIEQIYRFMSSYFNRSKVTNVVRDNVDYYIKANNIDNKYFIIDKNKFAWKEYKSISPLRVPTGDYIREINFIPTEELKDGMIKLISQNIEVTKDGLFKLLAGNLLFDKIGGNINAAFEKALDSLIKENIVAFDENKKVYYLI